MAITIRARTFESWMKANFDRGELSDIANHGASAGWHGLTYYTDTRKLYERFKDDLWEMAAEDCRDMGGKNTIEFLATLGGSNDVSDATTFENLMVWYGAERIARQLTD